MQYLQYQAESEVWHDSTPLMNPPSGDITLIWDNSGLGEFDAVRIKAIICRVLNTIQIKCLSIQILGDTCTFTGRNSLFEDLTLLRLRLQSNQDSRYVEWTIIRSMTLQRKYHSRGDFSIAPPEGTIRPGMSYRFRMIGWVKATSL